MCHYDTEKAVSVPRVALSPPDSCRSWLLVHFGDGEEGRGLHAPGGAKDKTK